MALQNGVKIFGLEKPHPLENVAAPGLSYYTPHQNVSPGTAVVSSATDAVPKLFSPLKVRGLELHNRIITSPMCQYSAHDGHLTPYHLAHLGAFFTRGPSLVFVEATAVLPNGRISPQDSGIWSDDHVTSPFGLKFLVDFAHSQGQKIGIQLFHAGRKSSIVADWVALKTTAPEEVGGWPEKVKSASAIQFDSGYPIPQELTLDELEEVKEAYKSAAQRALKAGFDAIEISAAHGYLLHSFLSPVSNVRTDQYGGSFENRVKLLLEIIDAVRSVLPDEYPLWVRISASDNLDVNPAYEGPSWTLDDSVKLANILADRGVDVLDVSSSGLHPQQLVKRAPGYQTHFAKAIKESLVKNGKSLLVSAVGGISEGKQAEAILTGSGDESISKGSQELDLIVAGYSFLLNPGLVFKMADDLGVKVSMSKQMS